MGNWKRIVNVLALVLIAQSAFASNTRSAVSINGLDTNPCTVASPCRSFTAALAQTVSGGEVIALDSAGYGPFTISQSVSVSAPPGVHAAITAASGDAIAITSGSPVFISGLVILGTGGGVNGIHNTGSVFVHISNCFVQGFSGSGILDQGLYVLRMVVDHTIVDTCANGINMDGGTGAIDNCSINQCTNDGVRVYNATSPVVATSIVTATMFRWNQNGVEVTGTGALSVASAKVDHCAFNANGNGVLVQGLSTGQGQVFLIGNTIDTTAGTGTYTMYTTGDNFISLNSATLTAWAKQ